MTYALMLTAMAAMVAGCRSHRETARTAVPDEGSEEVVVPPIQSVPYYTSKFTCTAQGMTANGQLRMQPDSIVWLSAAKVVELGRACFTPDSVIVYIKMMGRCFRGSYMDVYRRFHYRTTFDQVVEMVRAEDVTEQIEELAKRFGAEISLQMEPWQQVDKLTFPMAIPSRVSPL